MKTKRFWRDLTIFGLTMMIFTLLIGAYALYQARVKVLKLKQENEILKNDLGVVLEQYDAPFIIYRMEKK